MGIRQEFGQRCKELRARSGMSQEMLAYRAGLDRSYISGVERGERNISIVNLEKIAFAFNVSMSYLFADERFSATPAYQQKDFTIPFLERFKYSLDSEKKVLSFQVHGLLTAANVEYMSKTLNGFYSAYGKDELSVLVDHREMKASDGEIAVYSPEVAEKAVLFQQELTIYSKKVVALCNSNYMVQQLNHVAKQSGILEKATHLYDQDNIMVWKAFELLEISGNPLVKTIK
ncbi:helix-turn-helix transcriptional regulator [Paenibacillus tritici]|uniref:Helix-turn-helix transcriptional regulator n=1 Tax=Paenibacillus tritici TaxID=1873425 RepID=A0ABX2DX95_9BACL|nr:helix-turn-helix transcriptional regulator [Paenibacillus tritici]